MESSCAMPGVYETAMAGITDPVIGTEYCGWPRKGSRRASAVSIRPALSASAYDSQGSMRGWSLKSVNQSQAPSERASAAGASRRTRRVPRSARTAHLHRVVLPQHLLGRRGPFRRAAHEDAEVAVAEARVVADGHGELGDPRVDEHAGHRGEGADEHHHLEADDGVRDPA